VRELPGVADGFTQALQLMNKAIELGPRAATQLPKPNYRGNPPSGSRGGTPQPGTKAKRTRPAPTEVTFRSIVEEFASSHNLLFIPTGKSEEKSRMPLFRLSQNLDGKGGINVYLLDDVVWAPDGESGYRAIPLDEMVLRATRGRA
jgi:tuftelin-interacting protein 11